jgi:hypothetical protein
MANVLGGLFQAAGDRDAAGGGGIRLNLDITNYLGVQHSEYVDRIQGIALSNPSRYFSYREQVSRQIKQSALRQLYATLYQALRNGRRADGNTDLVQDMVAGSPNVSDQVVNEKCIALAKTLNHAFEEIIDELLCPVTADGMAKSRLKAAGNARNIP